MESVRSVLLNELTRLQEESEAVTRSRKKVAELVRKNPVGTLASSGTGKNTYRVASESAQVQKLRQALQQANTERS